MDTTNFFEQIGSSANAEAVRRGQWCYIDGKHVQPKNMEALKIAAAAKIEEWELQVPVDTVAFTDDLSKGDMIDHLIDTHGLDNFYVGGNVVHRGGTKATKEDLRKFHDAMHSEQSDPNAVFRLWGIWKDGTDEAEFRFTLGGHPFPAVKHTHMAVDVPDNVTEVAKAIRDNKPIVGKPMNAQERKLLTELVNNDFSGLKQQMRELAADTLASNIAEINADWDAKEKKIPDFAGQATDRMRKQSDEWAAMKARHEEERRKMSEKHTDGLKAIIGKAKEQGVTLREEQETYADEFGQKKTRPVYRAEVEGRRDAIKTATEENKQLLDRALMTLEKQRLAAQRKVLVSGVSQEAAEFLDTIPDARTMMVEAAQQGQPKAIEQNQS